MDINLLVNLTSRAWALSLLAQLDRGVPGRQASLLRATGASRAALTQSLAHLTALGLVERNPGHGHPLRPEFRLTATGAAVAPMASRILAEGDGQALLRRSWTVPVLAVCAAPSSFTQIRTRLGTVTDRALSQTLGQLQEQAWVARDLPPVARPQRPLYCAANAGLRIAQALHAAPRMLARSAPSR